MTPSSELRRRRSAPHFTQAILAFPAGSPAADPSDVERRCYRARRRAEAACRAAGVRHYFASWSFATVSTRPWS